MTKEHTPIHKISIEPNLSKVGVRNINIVENCLTVKTNEIDLKFTLDVYENLLLFHESITNQLADVETCPSPEFVEVLTNFLSRRYEIINRIIKDRSEKNNTS
jgi:hypothetical protein